MNALRADRVAVIATELGMLGRRLDAFGGLTLIVLGLVALIQGR